MAAGMPAGQGAPPPGAEKQGKGGAGGFGALVSNTFNGLADIGAVLEQAKAPPAAMQMVRKMQTDFQDLIEMLQGGGEDEGQEMSPKDQPVDAMAGPGGAMPVQQ